jgi:hypothetical protein
MDTLFRDEMPKPVAVAAVPPVIGFVKDRRIELTAELIDGEFLLLRSPSYIAPGTCFELFLMLKQADAPLYTHVQVVYVEQTSQDYGVAVQFRRATKADMAQWQRYCRDAQEAQDQAELLARTAEWSRRRTIVSVGMALSERMLSSLRQLRITAVDVEDEEEAVARTSLGGVDLVICDFDSAVCFGPRLSRRIAATQLATKTVVRVGEGRLDDLALCISSEATVAMVQSCPQDILLLRLVDLVRRKQLRRELELAVPLAQRNAKLAKSRSLYVRDWQRAIG